VLNRFGASLFAALVLVSLVVAACGDSVDPILRCVTNCVDIVRVEPATVIARPGDTLRYTATLHTIGTVKPGVSWSARPSEILDVDSTGRVVVRGLGAGNVLAVPVGDTSAFGYAVVWAVAGDTTVFPIFTRFDDPATGAPIEAYSAADSVVIGLTYLIGTAYSGPTVSTVEMTITGPGIDTTFTAPATTRNGLPALAAFRIGNPRRRVGATFGAVYTARLAFGLAGGGRLLSPVIFSPLPL
jgi:hypothetical protein